MLFFSESVRWAKCSMGARQECVRLPMLVITKLVPKYLNVFHKKRGELCHALHTQTHENGYTLEMDALSVGRSLWQGTWMADVDDGAN